MIDGQNKPVFAPHTADKSGAHPNQQKTVHNSNKRTCDGILSPEGRSGRPLFPREAQVNWNIIHIKKGKK